MAYQTGQAGSSTALLDIIKTFAAANGWTVNGAMISSANSWTDLSATTVSLLNWGVFPAISAIGYDSAAKTNPTTSQHYYRSPCYMAIYQTAFPVTYHLFSHQNPFEFFCVVDMGNGQFSWLGFGELDKGAANYKGGGYVSGPTVYIANGFRDYYNFSVEPSRIIGNDLMPTGLFLSGHNGGYGGTWCSGYINAEIDGKKWVGSFYGLGSSYPLCGRTPNAWNSQALLLPIRILAPVSAGYHMDLGCVPHARFIRINNYNAGDIITLGSERWKVFPFLKKTPTMTGGWDSGSLGWAIRYDGP